MGEGGSKGGVGYARLTKDGGSAVFVLDQGCWRSELQKSLECVLWSLGAHSEMVVWKGPEGAPGSIPHLSTPQEAHRQLRNTVRNPIKRSLTRIGSWVTAGVMSHGNNARPNLTRSGHCSAERITGS
jgi:hypothetical protein